MIGVRGVIGRNVTVRDSVLLGANSFEGDPRHRRGPAAEGPPLGVGDSSVLERVIVDKNCQAKNSVP